MIALIQRVTEASVRVDGELVGAIGPGLLALVAVEPGDDEARTARMAERLLGYRVFADAEGRMNLSLADTGGDLLLVSQFTLAADTGRGMRPSFTTAAPPGEGRRWFDRLLALCRERHAVEASPAGVGEPDPGLALVGSRRVETGRFGAHMVVSLANDGPVTFRLQS